MRLRTCQNQTFWPWRVEFDAILTRIWSEPLRCLASTVVLTNGHDSRATRLLVLLVEAGGTARERRFLAIGFGNPYICAAAAPQSAGPALRSGR